MTIDKAKLKALAEAATQGERTAEMCARGIPHVTTEEWDLAEVHVTSCANPMADAEFMAAACPATVLALLAEIERLTGFVVHRRSQAGEYDEAICKVAAQRDQLKTENEALRSASLAARGFIMHEAEVRGFLDETGQISHRHPRRQAAIAFIDAAMAKEASHD